MERQRERDVWLTHRAKRRKPFGKGGKRMKLAGNKWFDTMERGADSPGWLVSVRRCEHIARAWNAIPRSLDENRWTVQACIYDAITFVPCTLKPIITGTNVPPRCFDNTASLWFKERKRISRECLTILGQPRIYCNALFRWFDCWPSVLERDLLKYRDSFRQMSFFRITCFVVHIHLASLDSDYTFRRHCGSPIT